MPATKIILRCTECSAQNYYTEKNRQNVPDKLSIRKFCKRCRRHTTHDETRLKR